MRFESPRTDGTEEVAGDGTKADVVRQAGETHPAGRDLVRVGRDGDEMARGTGEGWGACGS